MFNSIQLLNIKYNIFPCIVSHKYTISMHFHHLNFYFKSEICSACIDISNIWSWPNISPLFPTYTGSFVIVNDFLFLLIFSYCAFLFPYEAFTIIADNRLHIVYYNIICSRMFNDSQLTKCKYHPVLVYIEYYIYFRIKKIM